MRECEQFSMIYVGVHVCVCVCVCDHVGVCVGAHKLKHISQTSTRVTKRVCCSQRHGRQVASYGQMYDVQTLGHEEIEGLRGGLAACTCVQGCGGGGSR